MAFGNFGNVYFFVTIYFPVSIFLNLCLKGGQSIIDNSDYGSELANLYI